jgi:hypothetical protein
VVFSTENVIISCIAMHEYKYRALLTSDIIVYGAVAKNYYRQVDPNLLPFNGSTECSITTHAK